MQKNPSKIYQAIAINESKHTIHNSYSRKYGKMIKSKQSIQITNKPKQSEKKSSLQCNAMPQYTHKFKPFAATNDLPAIQSSIRCYYYYCYFIASM